MPEQFNMDRGAEELDKPSLQSGDVTADEEFEEISSDEVDRVVAALEDLMETVESENIRVYLEDAVNNVYYLVYEEDETGDADPLAEAA